MKKNIEQQKLNKQKNDCVDVVKIGGLHNLGKVHFNGAT